MKSNIEIINELTEIIKYFTSYPDSNPKAGFNENVIKLTEIKNELVNDVNIELKKLLSHSYVRNKIIVNGFEIKKSEIEHPTFANWQAVNLFTGETYMDHTKQKCMQWAMAYS